MKSIWSGTRLPWSPIVALVTVGAAWVAVSTALDAPYLVPSPRSVVLAGWRHAPRLVQHTAITLTEVGLGFLAGFALAAVLGYVIYRVPRVDRILTPYLVATQAVPIVALAPLLVVWLGNGLATKVVVASLIVFFPMLVATVAGFRGIDPADRDLMRAYSATSRQMLWHLEIPAALPVLAAAVKVGLTLAVIGAVVGEFVGADRGLGAAIQIARGQYNTSLMYAATLILVGISVTLYASASAIQRRAMSGRRPPT